MQNFDTHKQALKLTEFKTVGFPLVGLSVNSAKITDRSDMTSSVYRGHKAIIKQTEETMKTAIVAPPLILHWTYDNYLSAVVKFL